MKFISNHIWCIRRLIYHRPGGGGEAVGSSQRWTNTAVTAQSPRVNASLQLSLSVMKCVHVHVHVPPAVTLIDDPVALM